MGKTGKTCKGASRVLETICAPAASPFGVAWSFELMIPGVSIETANSIAVHNLSYRPKQNHAAACVLS